MADVQFKQCDGCYAEARGGREQRLDIRQIMYENPRFSGDDGFLSGCSSANPELCSDCRNAVDKAVEAVLEGRRSRVQSSGDSRA